MMPTVVQPKTPYHGLGQAIELMCLSSVYGDSELGIVCPRVLACIAAGNAVFIKDNERIVAFATFAKLNLECENRWKLQQRNIGPNDVNSGDRVWVIDACFNGHSPLIVEEIKKRTNSGKIQMLELAATARVPIKTLSE